jgi:hypothetical protein
MAQLPCIISPPAPSFAKTFQEAYACGKDLSYDEKPAEQETLLSLLREAETLCEDERIMGLLPCVLDGYAWVLGVLAGMVSASAQAQREKEICL